MSTCFAIIVTGKNFAITEVEWTEEMKVNRLEKRIDLIRGGGVEMYYSEKCAYVHKDFEGRWIKMSNRLTFTSTQVDCLPVKQFLFRLELVEKNGEFRYYNSVCEFTIAEEVIRILKLTGEHRIIHCTRMLDGFIGNYIYVNPKGETKRCLQIRDMCNLLDLLDRPTLPFDYSDLAVMKLRWSKNAVDSAEITRYTQLNYCYGTLHFVDSSVCISDPLRVFRNKRFEGKLSAGRIYIMSAKSPIKLEMDHYLCQYSFDFFCVNLTSNCGPVTVFLMTNIDRCSNFDDIRSILTRKTIYRTIDGAPMSFFTVID